MGGPLHFPLTLSSSGVDTPGGWRGVLLGYQQTPDPDEYRFAIGPLHQQTARLPQRASDLVIDFAGMARTHVRSWTVISG